MQHDVAHKEMMKPQLRPIVLRFTSATADQIFAYCCSAIGKSFGPLEQLAL